MLYAHLLLLSAVSAVLSANDRSLFIVLIDGVRRDYIDEEVRYGFKELRENGVEAEYLRPITPSNSFPNWYTIATGKYAESHGFVNNYMYDRERKEYFPGDSPEKDDAVYWWNQTEPIWITAEKNGIRTGVYWWNGCQTKIDGVRPTECVRYKSFATWPTVNQDTAKQVSVVLRRIKKNELRLAMLYYEPVDTYGHLLGPDSEDRKKSLRTIDKILYDLQAEIKELHLEEKLDLVVVSDHGMSEIFENETKIIEIGSAVEDEDIEVMLDVQYFSMLWPVKGKEGKVYNDLKSKRLEGLHVYKKEEMPEKYHFKNNRLIAPIILMAEKAYAIAPYPNEKKMKPFVLFGSGSLFLAPGVHGFDPYSNATTEMRTIFYARGPSFKRNYTSPPMEMTDVYNVFCYSLGMEPLPNNGSWNRVEDFLVKPNRLIANVSLDAIPNPANPDDNTDSAADFAPNTTDSPSSDQTLYR